MRAIILAGEGEENKRYFKQGKPLLKFKDKPLIEYTIDALRESQMVDYILVVGNKRLLSPSIGDKVDKIIEQENDILDNLIKGISYLKGEENVLVATCDIPLITSEAIEHFITAALNFKVDLCYPIIEKSRYEAKYPNVKRTYVTLKEGCFTGGNLAMINPYKIRVIENQIKPLIRHRKNPLKMAKVLGMTITTQLLLKQLTIGKLETYVKETFNISGKALISPYPEIASDIDNIEDIKILEKYM